MVPEPLPTPATAAPDTPTVMPRLEVTQDDDGAVQVGIPALFRLAHHVVVVARASGEQDGPQRVAERIASLDLVSNGRVEFGTGESAAELELGGFGVSPAERQQLRGQGPQGPLRTLRGFDAAITAPRWGYTSVDDYYAQASPLGPLLEGAAASLPPTLLVHAADDPWVPVASIRRLAAAEPSGISLVISPQGGHNGFHGRGDRAAGQGCWGDRLTARWLSRLLGQGPTAAAG